MKLEVLSLKYQEDVATMRSGDARAALEERRVKQ